VIIDTFQSTLFSEVSKLRHLLAEQITLHPPCIDPDDLRIMQSETMTEYMIDGRAGYGHCAHRAGSEFPSSYYHEMKGHMAIPRLEDDNSRWISGRKTQVIPTPIMSSYGFLPPVIKSTLDTLGIWDGDIKAES
jgi:hypothetical protein